METNDMRSDEKSWEIRGQVKGTVHPKIRAPYFPLANLDCFAVSFLVMEISAIEISAFTQI